MLQYFETAYERELAQSYKDRLKECKNYYGFLANPKLTITQNIRQHILQTPLSQLFSNSKPKFHNLCPNNIQLPPNTATVLGLGSKFCIETPTPPNDLQQTLSKLTRAIRLQYWVEIMCNETNNNEWTKNSLYINNTRFVPPIADVPTERANYNFRDEIIHLKSTLQQKPHKNLSKHLYSTLKKLRTMDNIIIRDSDKNLGICIMSRDNYIKSVMEEHLLQEDTYEKIPKWRAIQLMSSVENDIKLLVNESNEELTKADRTFFQRSFAIQHRVPVFYGTPKIHKGKMKNGLFKTRPVVSKIGSFIEIASKFCDHYLAKLIPFVTTYLKDSFELLHDLSQLPQPLPPRTQLLTADAISMYTNIDTNHGLEILERFIRRYSNQIHSFPTETVIVLLTHVMNSNIFSFGDLYFLQISGTAMGTIVAVRYATIYCASHEEEHIIPKYQNQLLYFRRFIDDIFIIWRPGRYNHNTLQQDLNFGKLRWIVSPPSSSVDFLDLTIEIDSRGHIKTKTYEKPLNLHLYLPALSAHPPGTLKSLIVGFIRRYWLMNTSITDYNKQVTLLATRLSQRGYTKATIDSAIMKASELVQKKMPYKKVFQKRLHKEHDKEESTLFFQRTYHPRSIPSSLIQRTFDNTIKKKNLFHRMIICNKRAKNIKDKLCNSTLTDLPGNNPSDFLRQEGHFRDI